MKMSRRMSLLLLPAALVAGLAGTWAWLKPPRRAGPELLARAYDRPLPPVSGPRRVYHLGHSLVGRDMPAMLAQLAPEGHGYESQLGWGASLRDHWEPDVPVKGFETENAHPRFRSAQEAIDSGEYDAVVLTEMAVLTAAIRYHDSPEYLHRWAERARRASPDTLVYLYETWQRRDTPEGWLEQIDHNLPELWEGRLVDFDLLAAGPDRPIRVIPAGQVLATFVRMVEAKGGVDGIAGRADLFTDEIHLSDLGAYLVALTHYAVLYRQSPVGLPHALSRADGTPADAPGAVAARLMQEVVWATVTGYPRSGVAG